MNYLAHAYLSFQQPEILVGNMISDFVKGKKQFDFPVGIQTGIRLHRDIDTYTDTHPATKEARTVFKTSVGPYSGAFVDVVYDHFLALDTGQFSEEAWKTFSQETYGQLSAFSYLLPEKFAQMLPYMSSQDWLYNYRFTWGIENSFKGLVRRAKYLSDSAHAFTAFMEEYPKLQTLYHDFFPDVKNYVTSQLTTHATI